MRKIIYLFIIVLVPSSFSAQLQNLNFEQWDNAITANGQDNRPTGWIWSNSATIDATNLFYYPPSTDAYSGNYALKLSLWYNYTKDVAIKNESINYRPVALKGYYKYEQNIVYGPNGPVTDIAKVSVLLTKTINNQTVTVGSGTLDLLGSNTYKEFNVPINYITNDTPNNITITLDPSLARRGNVDYQYQTGDGTTSYFTVDNLSLTTATLGVIDHKLDNSIIVYPNPADDYIHIPNFKGNISIYDLTGKLVLSNKEIVNELLAIDFLVPGPYILKLNNGTEGQTVKFVKK